MKKLKTILQYKLFYFLLGIFVLVYCITTTKIIKYESNYNINNVCLEGIVIDYIIDGNKLDLTIKAREKVKAVYYINTEEEKSRLQQHLLIGSIIKLSGSFNKPINNTIPNTFNYKKYLYNKKIY